MTDVRLYHDDDGGEIAFVNGSAVMADGLESAVYLSLFGGNEDDSGTQADDRKQWWGNLSETDAARKLRSETQHLLRSLPAVPFNLRRLTEAVERDLAWMKSSLASQVSVLVTIPGLNRVSIAVSIELQNGRQFQFSFHEPWGAGSR